MRRCNDEEGKVNWTWEHAPTQLVGKIPIASYILVDL